MNALFYEETSRNPFARLIRLTEPGLAAGSRLTPVNELNLVAMADAYQRGRWLGGGGSERPFDDFGQDRAVVPVTRASGSSQPVKVRRPANFAQALGELALRLSGGPDRVTAQRAQAGADGVPLWLARRFAEGPSGRRTAVAVDRRSGRADVWAEGVPAVRIRAPSGVPPERRDPARGLRVTVGAERAEVTIDDSPRGTPRTVRVHTAQYRWELRRDSRRTSRLLSNGKLVALITRPPEPPGNSTGLAPLAQVEYRTRSMPVAVMAHACALAFGLGNSSGTVRLGGEQRLPAPDHPAVWGQPWYSGLSPARADSGPADGPNVPSGGAGGGGAAAGCGGGGGC